MQKLLAKNRLATSYKLQPNGYNTTDYINLAI